MAENELSTEKYVVETKLDLVTLQAIVGALLDTGLEKDETGSDSKVGHRVEQEAENTYIVTILAQPKVFADVIDQFQKLSSNLFHSRIHQDQLMTKEALARLQNAQTIFFEGDYSAYIHQFSTLCSEVHGSDKVSKKITTVLRATQQVKQGKKIVMIEGDIIRLFSEKSLEDFKSAYWQLAESNNTALQKYNVEDTFRRIRTGELSYQQMRAVVAEFVDRFSN